MRLFAFVLLCSALSLWGQQPTTAPPGRAINRGVTTYVTPPTEMDQLRARITDLEQEVEALKQSRGAAVPVALTAPKDRIKGDGKADDAKQLMNSVNDLWKAIDQIWANLDKLNQKR